MSRRSEIYRRIKAKTENIRENSVISYIRNPLFTLSGNSDFTAQGAVSVEKYGENEIAVKINRMNVTVNGRGLEMCFYNKFTVKITGVITSLSFDSL